MKTLNLKIPASAFALALLLAGHWGCSPSSGRLQHPGDPGGSGGQSRTRVLLVTWDGAKPSVLEGQIRLGRLPNLESLVGGGCFTWRARCVGRTVTLPSHVTLLTGLHPKAHGVTWNKDRPETGPVQADTLFDLCSRNGVQTAMVYGKPKLRILLKPGSPGSAILLKGGADEVAAAVVKALSGENAGFVFAHFAQPDDAGHDHGWGDEKRGDPASPQYLESLRECDAALGTLLAALREGGGWQQTLVLLTADHGGHGKDHGTRDPEDRLIPWVAAGGLVSRRGPIRGKVTSLDTAPTVLEALRIPAPSSMKGRAVSIKAAALRPAA